MENIVIKEFVDAYFTHKEKLESVFKQSNPSDYTDIVKAVIDVINPHAEYGYPDVRRITKIDHGDYQGMLVYVIGASGYQPSKYWYVCIDYGSCSGCDTLQAIRECHDYSGTATESQVSQYMTLALHIVQKLKPMNDRNEEDD